MDSSCVGTTSRLLSATNVWSGTVSGLDGDSDDGRTNIGIFNGGSATAHATAALHRACDRLLGRLHGIVTRAAPPSTSS